MCYEIEIEMKMQKSKVASTHSSLQTSCNDQTIAAFKYENQDHTYYIK